MEIEVCEGRRNASTAVLYNGSPMEIRERQVGPATIVELSGRLTVNDQPGLLKEAVANAVVRGARNVLLDLSGVRYIDSTRLGELIAAHVTVTRQGGKNLCSLYAVAIRAIDECVDKNGRSVYDAGIKPTHAAPGGWRKKTPVHLVNQIDSCREVS